jgi:hypothetical protein
MHPSHSPSNNPILVTGAHRSGTTWVGKMLAANQKTAYISEPLNLLHRSGVCRAEVQHWYPYICQENEANFLAPLQETLRFSYHPWLEIKSIKSTKDLMRMARDATIFLRARTLHQRTLLKDPFALFSIPWFIQRLQCQVVVVVRHPLAFVSSLKRLKWSFDFNHLLKQPLLMRDLLTDFHTEMTSLLQQPNDVIAQGSLLWRILYQVASSYQEQYPTIQVIRHEDLSISPIEHFSRLYASLDLPFTTPARSAILRSTRGENPSELSTKRVHAVKLDSQANLQNWKKRLSTAEIAQISQLTRPLTTQYYPEFEWE